MVIGIMSAETVGVDYLLQLPGRQHFVAVGVEEEVVTAPLIA
jgi:hypothetical protein